MSKCRDVMTTSVEDMRSLRLWRALAAEMLGTALLVFIGCGSCITMATEEQLLKGEGSRPTIVQISLCFGLSVATVVWALGHVSGGHVNPAVTIGLLAARRVSVVRALLYVVGQLAGSVLGAGLLYAVTPRDRIGGLGTTVPGYGVTPGQAVGLEILIGFVLVFVVFSSIDTKRNDLGGSKPLTIGLAVTACHLFAVPFTGSSMNTARSFGPALVMGVWTEHWVYWVGPILGGLLAAVLYEHVFAVNASLAKVKGCLLNSRYDNEDFKAKAVRLRIIEEVPLDDHDRNGDPAGEAEPLSTIDLDLDQAKDTHKV